MNLESVSETNVGSANSVIDDLRIVCSGYSSGQAMQNSMMTSATRFTIMASGSTYPHRDVLKQLGLRWDHAEKAWRGTVDRDQLKQVERLDNVRLLVIPRNRAEVPKEPESDVTPAPEKTADSPSTTPVEPKPVDKADNENSVCGEKFICEKHDWLCQNCDFEEYRNPEYATGYISTAESAEKLLRSDYYLYRLDGARRTDQLHGCIHALLVNGRTADEIKAIIRESQRSAWAILAKNWTEGLDHSRRCVFGDFSYGKNENGIPGREAEIAKTMKITDNVKTWTGHTRDEYDMLVELHKRIGKFPPEEPGWLAVLEKKIKEEFLATVNQPS